MAATAARACGFRQAGGLYLETALSRHGLPLEYFLVDPSELVDPQALGLSAIGMTLIEKHGVYHIADWVGEHYYPKPADFYAEVREMGASRRAPSTLDFGKLTIDSRMLLFHTKAWMQNVQDYAAALRPPDELPWLCVKHLEEHRKPAKAWVSGGITCATVWLSHDAEVREGEEPNQYVTRQANPTTVYQTFTRPEGVKPVYASDLGRTALFLALPINRIVGVRDPEDHEGFTKKVEKTRRAHLPFAEVDE